MYPNPLSDGPSCFFARHGRMENGDPMPPCEGRLVRCHLLDKQELVRRGLDPWDPATWEWGCGGHNYGNEGHHGLFDGHRLHVPFEALRRETVEFAERHGLVGRLRRYKIAAGRAWAATE